VRRVRHYGVSMRWERLFDDLEAQAEADERAGFEAELGDLVRAERGALTLADRLRAHVGCDLTWSLADGELLHGELLELGADWVLLRPPGADVVLPLAEVIGIGGLSRSAVAETGLRRSLRLTLVLRGLARDRSAVVVFLPSGARLTGTIDRVGADHVDLAVHDLDQPRRAWTVSAVRCVPIAAVRRIAVS
jgi:hypothetical protein